MSVQDGFGVIAGRSQKNAQNALAAADAAGVDRALVTTVDEGYLVPLAVLDEYHRIIGVPVTDEEPAQEKKPRGRPRKNTASPSAKEVN
jgi:hypothetical protein